MSSSEERVEYRPLSAIPVKDYPRPLSAPEIPVRYPIDSTADEALKGTERLLVPRSGVLGLNPKINYALVFEELDAEDAVMDQVKRDVRRASDNIYSITARGMRLNELHMDSLFCDLLRIGTLKYLCELDLSYNRLSYSTLGVLFKSLRIAESGYCPIKRLLLTRCGIGTRGIASLWRAIQGSVFIEEVAVNGNYCGDEGMEGLGDVLSFRDCKITELGIGDNNLTVVSMKILADAILKNSSLKTLQVHQNPFGDEGATLLFQAINFHNGIESVNMSGCSLKDCRWAENLRISVKLTTLYLNNNEISDEGFRAICDTLDSCFSLRHLDLSNNLFNGRLCMALGPAIRANKGLLSLSIAGNKILIPDVWVSIKLGLLENKTLLKLDLSYCEIKPELAKIICSVFALNVTCDINLDFNPLPLTLTTNPRAYKWQEKRIVVPLSRRARMRKDARAAQDMEYCQPCDSLPLSESAPGTSLRESLLWRNGMLAELKNAKEALAIVETLGYDKSDPNDGRDAIVRINPLAAEAKRISALRTWVDSQVDKFGFGEKLLRVFYGHESQEIGYIHVTDSTTYEQAKDLIKPLVREYFASSNPLTIDDMVDNFRVLDHNGLIVEGNNAKLRTVWQEAALNECKLFLRPSNWISLPKGDDDDE